MGFHRDDVDSPPGPLDELAEGYFGRILAEHDSSATPWEETDFPLIDIYEEGECIMVEAEIPGLDPANLEVFITGGILVIEGLKEEVIDSGRVNFLCMERRFGNFRRMVPLLQPVNSALVKARYSMGILQIRIPKVEEKRGRRKTIPVMVE